MSGVSLTQITCSRSPSYVSTRCWKEAICRNININIMMRDDVHWIRQLLLWNSTHCCAPCKVHASKKNKMIDHLRELSSLETCKTTLLEMFLWKKKLHQHMPEKHFPIYFSWNFSRLMTLIYRAAELPVRMSVLTDQ